MLKVFQKFKAMVEWSNVLMIKVLRTDGGGEYTYREFQEFYKEKGIEHKGTPPYLLYHNGSVKRKK